MEPIIAAVQLRADEYAGYVRPHPGNPLVARYSIEQVVQGLERRAPMVLGHCLETALKLGDARLARALIAQGAPASVAAVQHAADSELPLFALPARPGVCQGEPLLAEVLQARARKHGVNERDDILTVVFDRWDRVNYKLASDHLTRAIGNLRESNPALIDSAIQQWLDMAGEAGRPFGDAARSAGVRVAVPQKPPTCRLM